MVRFPRHAGAAAGLFGFSAMALAALTGVWMGATFDGTVYPLVFTMTAYAAVLFAIVFGWVNRLDAGAIKRRARYPEGEDSSL